MDYSIDLCDFILCCLGRPFCITDISKQNWYGTKIFGINRHKALKSNRSLNWIASFYFYYSFLSFCHRKTWLKIYLYMPLCMCVSDSFALFNFINEPNEVLVTWLIFAAQIGRNKCLASLDDFKNKIKNCFTFRTRIKTTKPNR